MLNPELAVNRRPIDRLSRNSAISRLGARLQPLVANIVTSAGVPVANVLHGTVLGHPLHAMLTDIPVGAWTVTAALDALEFFGGQRNPGSDAALAVGLAGAAGAILTGWADWSDTDQDARTLGMAHALVNGTAVTAYLAALTLRRGQRRRLGLLLSLAAYGIVSAGAYVGGELSYGLMLGIKHTAEPLIPAAEFTPVLDASELGTSQPASADFGGIPLLISRVPDGVAAISAICTHRGAPLADGEFADGCVRCPWHGSTFALEDGHVIDGPATFPQPRFEARVNGDKIEVRALDV
jgi:nitrite reductase/ring-hydroxylating ferredoxin subunit/uncharacterized membrane protein